MNCIFLNTSSRLTFFLYQKLFRVLIIIVKKRWDHENLNVYHGSENIFMLAAFLVQFSLFWYRFGWTCCMNKTKQLKKSNWRLFLSTVPSYNNNWTESFRCVEVWYSERIAQFSSSLRSLFLFLWSSPYVFLFKFIFVSNNLPKSCSFRFIVASSNVSTQSCCPTIWILKFYDENY